MSLAVDSQENLVFVDPTSRKVSSLRVELSADKSITHRAIFFAAMSRGVSVIRNPSTGADCMATLSAMKAFGVQCEEGRGNASEWRINSPGLDHWQSPGVPIDAMNSGTTSRLLMGIAAARPGLSFSLIGDESLSKRPMDRITRPLKFLGADISGVQDGAFLPMKIAGASIKGFQIASEVPSAQVKSALLFAAISARGPSEITVPSGTRDHTERMMKALGAPLESLAAGDKTKFTIQGPWQPKPFAATIPGDPSSMAFFATLAFLHPGLEIKVSRVLNNPGRLKYLELFKRIGLTVELSVAQTSACLGEETVDVKLIRTGAAKPLTLASEDVPAVIDELPTLAVALSCCPGTSYLAGLRELRVKESDRLAETVDLLERAGVKARAIGDDLEIKGGGQIQGFSFQSDDHRMVMAATILATSANKISKIGTYEAPKVSFPLFFEIVRQLYG